jgi:release factor glutamine methyltransferase
VTKSWLLDISSRLAQDKAKLVSGLGLDSGVSRIEVQMLLQAVLKAPRSYLLAHPEQVLDAAQNAAYDAMLQRRLQGEPIAHILGEREFFGLSLKVTSDTLIPRPDTELLVELALQRLPQGQSCRVLDLGTGSGAIALAIAHSRPDAEIVAVDASKAALLVARENAERLGISNVSFLQSDWFSALDGQRFDLIVSNPPYIAAGDAHLSQGDVRFEPMTALTSGVDGLDDIRRIASWAGAFMRREAWLLLEHGYDQAQSVRDILLKNDFTEIYSAKDIAGIERVSAGKLRK